MYPLVARIALIVLDQKVGLDLRQSYTRVSKFALNVDGPELANALTWTLRLAVDEIEAVADDLQRLRTGEDNDRISVKA